MKTESQVPWIIPSGKVSSRFKIRMSKRPLRQEQDWHPLWVAFSEELDEAFVRHFRKTASPSSRVLVFNEHLSADTLLSRFVAMRIRSAERFYVADFGAGKSSAAGRHLLNRLTACVGARDTTNRILDARIEEGCLHVVSPDFLRLNVPIEQIDALKNADAGRIHNFEIDEDGSFLYWPDLDLHLGWDQLQQIVDPEAARKAMQRNQQFNERYGQAVRKLREEAGLKFSDVPEISEKQLRRIEKGECRLTSNAVKALSHAHRLAPKDYMNQLAEKLHGRG